MQTIEYRGFTIRVPNAGIFKASRPETEDILCESLKEMKHTINKMVEAEARDKR